MVRNYVSGERLASVLPGSVIVKSTMSIDSPGPARSAVKYGRLCLLDSIAPF